MDNTKITTTELDFDQIKSSLKTYLQGQSQFTDYDFEGSGLSVLLDVLAYNTHYNALYTNLAINEAFLDSASKRSSVVSRARELGYMPRSARCSTAVVDVTMINEQIDAPTTIEIPIYTPFSGQINGVQYTFYTTQAHTAQRVDSTYTFEGIELKEGSILTRRYQYSSGTVITIPNTGADLTTLKVTVQENSSSSTFVTYSSTDTIIDIDGTSTVYFVKEIDNGLYQLEFGDGVVGKQLSTGNIINLTYMIGNADSPNGIGSFLYNGTSIDDTDVFVDTVSSAINGSISESIDSIKWNAPHAYAAQNRCVTVTDYRTIITSLFSSALAVSVWGGEENTPPQYGKVFISIIPRPPAEFLTDSEKSYIINDILAPRKSLTVIPEIIDPTYIKLMLDITFYYNPQHTTRSSGDITALIEQTVEDYNSTYLNSFEGVFKHSRFSRMIDDSENSITSSITTIKLYREVTPTFNVDTTYKINLNNPIYNSGVPEESIISSGFYVSGQTEVCYIDDLPVEDASIGALRLFYRNASGQKVTVSNIGTVNYSTGIIELNNLHITSLYATSFNLTVKPQSNDVVSSQNQFVEIDPSMVTISSVVDLPTKSYTFTSSRN